MYMCFCTCRRWLFVISIVIKSDSARMGVKSPCMCFLSKFYSSSFAGYSIYLFMVWASPI